MFFFISSAAFALPIEYFISKGPIQPHHSAQSSVEALDMQYSSPLQLSPVLPLIPWGLRFDEDLMIALDDPVWGMIEVGKVETPNGDVWFSLDSLQDGRQWVGLEDSDIGHSLVKSFPARTYTNDLEVQEKSIKGGTEYSVFYRRQDSQIISFSMTGTDEPSIPRKRNGHAMNHSADQTLAFLDLSTLELNAKSLEWEHHPQKTYSIFGKSIVARMQQSVGGIHSGQWTQTDGNLYSYIGDTPLVFEDSSDHFIVRTLDFPSIEYRFKPIHGQLRLEEINVLQPHPEHEAAVMKLRFSPPLPDLRYGAPLSPFKSWMTTELNGQSNYANTQITISQSKENTLIEVKPKEPKWASNRPLYILHHPSPMGIETYSRVLTRSTPVPHIFHMKSTAPNSGPIIGQQSLLWEKNPHRISKLSIHPESSSISGGTWANGERAKDTINSEIEAYDSIVSHYTHLLPMIPLIQDIGSDARILRGQMEVNIPINLDSGEHLIPFIQGFEIDSGPFHTQTGMTLQGIDVSIDDIQKTDEGVCVNISAAIPFGKVPDRKQDLEHYSATFQLDLGLLIAPASYTTEKFDLTDFKVLPKYRTFKKLYPSKSSAETEVGYLQQWGFTILDDGPHTGRYIRGISISSHPNLELDGIEMKAKWSRETKVKMSKKVVTLTPEH